MPKMAAIGDKTSILGFGALGIDAYIVAEAREAEELWRVIVEKDYSVVLITEQLYEQLKEKIALVSEQLTPAVLIMPDSTGGRGVGFGRLKEIVETAVGADILTERKTRI